MGLFFYLNMDKDNFLNFTLTEWLDYIENIHFKVIDLTLERMLIIANDLGLTKFSSKIITVTGTNGKGSVTNLLSKFIHSKGFSTCVYNSPHLLKFNERIVIEGKPVSDEELLNSFKIIESKRRDKNVSLTFFEFTTLAALLIFKNHPCDYIILEVGMGGRFDSTNIVDADLSIITNVALDHTAFLGSNREEIGYQKVGIVKKNSVLIYGEKDIPQSVVDWSSLQNSKIYYLSKDFDYIQQSECWKLSLGDTKFNELVLPSIPIVNASMVLMTLKILNLSFTEEEINQILSQFKMPGRFQIIQNSPMIIADVGHNSHAFSYLKKRINHIKTRKQGKLYCVLGMLSDKDFAITINDLSTFVDQFYFCSLDGPRGTKSKELQDVLSNDIQKKQSKLYNKPIEAFDAAISLADSEDIILVAGSFHTVGQIFEYYYKDFDSYIKNCYVVY